jgi:1-deoxy-D-xylulose-5-phosphate synthase
VCIEDGIRVGGVGTRIRQDLRAAGIDTAVDELGLPAEFLEHDTRDNILRRVGLDADSIATKIRAQLKGTQIPKAKP